MALTSEDVRALLRAKLAVQKHDAMAADLGVTQGYLSKVLVGGCNPGKKLLLQLGLRKVVRYETTNTKPNGGR